MKSVMFIWSNQDGKLLRQVDGTLFAPTAENAQFLERYRLVGLSSLLVDGIHRQDMLAIPRPWRERIKRYMQKMVKRTFTSRVSKSGIGKGA